MQIDLKRVDIARGKEGRGLDLPNDESFKKRIELARMEHEAFFNEGR